MPEEPYKVQLENIFEGPMDLLVYLVKKNELDIYDIPISQITDQYLEYIAFLKALNVDIAGSFMVMAATLTQLKSKMLLPSHEEGEEDELTEQLTKPLLEYLQMKSAAERLSQCERLGEDTFKRPPEQLQGESDEPEMIAVSLFELIDAFKRILQNIAPEMQVEFTADSISVKDKIAEIVDLLEKKSSLTFNELFRAGADKSEIIATFLAILEMVKLRLTRIAQHVQSGVIRLFYI